MNCDFSYLEGTDCYCSPQSAALIRQAISSLNLNDVHHLGTGDYHYVSLFWLEQIEEPFCLLLVDNHPDNQAYAFGNILSCGSWIIDASTLPHFKSLMWVDGNGFVHGKLDKDYPVYLSVDLDALSTDYARTNWSQGSLSLPRLMEILDKELTGRKLLGADICGGLKNNSCTLSCDCELNHRTASIIESRILQLLHSNPRQ